LKLIVGLGNPGDIYKNTRHNVGFEMLDLIAVKENIEINKQKFDGLYGELNYGNEKIILLKPQKFMNLSGLVVKKYIDNYKIDLENILVIHDDLDLEIGKYKLFFKHGDGGHNGIKNINENLNSNEYYRLKVGISKNKNIDTKDYVLSKFTKEEMESLENTYQKLLDIVFDFSLLEKTKLLQKYNTKETIENKKTENLIEDKN